MVKNFLEFIKESNDHEYGCLMIHPDIDNQNKITSLIDKDDLYQPNNPNYGIQNNPHVTILYGLHSDVKFDDIRNIIDDYNSPIDIEIDGIGVFNNEEFDVVKLNVKSDSLHELNKKISEFPHTTDYPDYNPHMTIAYVKPGLGNKYLSDEFRRKFKDVRKFYYTGPNQNINYTK